MDALKALRERLPQETTRRKRPRPTRPKWLAPLLASSALLAVVAGAAVTPNGKAFLASLRPSPSASPTPEPPKPKVEPEVSPAPKKPRKPKPKPATPLPAMTKNVEVCVETGLLPRRYCRTKSVAFHSEAAIALIKAGKLKPSSGKLKPPPTRTCDRPVCRECRRHDTKDAEWCANSDRQHGSLGVKLDLP